MKYIKYTDETTGEHLIYKVISIKLFDMYHCKYCNYILYESTTRNLRAGSNVFCLSNEEKIIKDIIE